MVSNWPVSCNESQSAPRRSGRQLTGPGPERTTKVMTRSDDQNVTATPANTIRRFDVFAEYSRQERLDKGYAEDEAKGYGIWLAKVVAARRFGKSSAPSGSAARSDSTGTVIAEPKFRSVGDELQTDETFDHDIIERMGGGFYDNVFVPAIAEARANGESYEAIRDSIRRQWKPAKSRAR